MKCDWRSFPLIWTLKFLTSTFWPSPSPKIFRRDKKFFLQYWNAINTAQCLVSWGNTIVNCQCGNRSCNIYIFPIKLQCSFIFLGLKLPPKYSLNLSGKLHLYSFFLADPGEARGCSTNTFVTHWFIHWLSDPLVPTTFMQPWFFTHPFRCNTIW